VIGRLRGTLVAREGAHVVIRIADNGRGFDPDVVQQGSSLGLKLIRERAEMLGGSFEMDSAIGKGARISFAVPARS